MSIWHNESGRPLSAISWLEAHHRAKLLERTTFAKRVLSLHPKRIIDLGCGPGIWLELFNQYASPGCELVGLDVDIHSIGNATHRANCWSRKSRFLCVDIEAGQNDIPEADIYLAFNIFPYIKNIEIFIETLRHKMNPGGFIIIRQYDGGLLRLGPMNSKDRLLIDSSLHNAVHSSEQFMHYDLDRVFESIGRSQFLSQKIEFEVFKRVAPYPNEFLPYLTNTINWTLNYVSEEAASKLKNWFNKHKNSGFTTPSYFSEVDLVAWLS